MHELSKKPKYQLRYGYYAEYGIIKQVSKPHFILGIIFYLVALAVFSAYFLLDLNDDIYLSPIDRIIFLVITSIAMYIGGKLLARTNPSLHFLFKLNLIIWFILYIFLIITLTQLDRYSYRDDFGKYVLYDSRPVNFIPFNTITIYTTKYFDGCISTVSFLYNILGNIVALMPLALFLPLLFKQQNSFFRFFLTTLCVTLLIEIVQFVTMSGTCDIDDVILNLFGACILFCILQIPPVKTSLHRFFLPDKEQNPTSRQLPEPTNDT